MEETRRGSWRREDVVRGGEKTPNVSVVHDKRERDLCGCFPCVNPRKSANSLSQGWVHSGYKRVGSTICLDIL